MPAGIFTLRQPWRNVSRRGRASRDDVGDQTILKVLDAIADGQLALLEALDRQMVGTAGGDEGVDGGIHVTMLLTELDQFAADFLLFFFGHTRRRVFFAKSVGPLPLTAARPETGATEARGRPERDRSDRMINRSGKKRDSVRGPIPRGTLRQDVRPGIGGLRSR